MPAAKGPTIHSVGHSEDGTGVAYLHNGYFWPSPLQAHLSPIDWCPDAVDIGQSGHLQATSYVFTLAQYETTIWRVLSAANAMQCHCTRNVAVRSLARRHARCWRA